MADVPPDGRRLQRSEGQNAMDSMRTGPDHAPAEMNEDDVERRQSETSHSRRGKRASLPAGTRIPPSRANYTG